MSENTTPAILQFEPTGKAAIPGDLMEKARALVRLSLGGIPFQHAGYLEKQVELAAPFIARALLAERQKHDRPASPDLQAVAERVFAELDGLIPHDAEAVIAKALQAATDAERDRWMAYRISETDRLLNRVR